MSYFSHGRFQQQFRFLSRQFLQDEGLALSNVLSRDTVSDVLKTTECCWVDKIYTPLVTLWVFLNQVLSSDHSCRWAVGRLIAHRLSQGQSPCSAETGGYCQARKRLPEEFFSEVARKTGQALDASACSNWLWKDRPVYMFDGATVMMPDTPENQKAYPQNSSQKPGLGFPIARIGAIFSLSCGAVVDLAISRYAGKGQGESTMMRTLWDIFRPGDILLTDSLLCSVTFSIPPMGRRQARIGSPAREVSPRWRHLCVFGLGPLRSRSTLGQIFGDNTDIRHQSRAPEH